ncbi:hypothetical protein G3578_03360 [Brevibacillus sp. SYP-B805]|uniref:hypothetical protein n=1 Tax=Brevibacillus sp. SYP-B805 TaxID=1578199 RepID=UPI0013EE1508|nr:hypothetical protein [Brevibacillus sp. SYP-B805]NGQ94212.1 hypothetical protein [Brevibacillus sp. SYP-B805]
MRARRVIVEPAHGRMGDHQRNVPETDRVKARLAGQAMKGVPESPETAAELHHERRLTATGAGTISQTVGAKNRLLRLVHPVNTTNSFQFLIDAVQDLDDFSKAM